MDGLYLVGAGTHPGAGAAGRALVGPRSRHGGAGCRELALSAATRRRPTSPPAARCCARARAPSFAASLLLPAGVRGPATVALRLLPPGRRRGRPRTGGRLERCRGCALRLARVYAGRPLPLPVDRALADVVGAIALSREALPEALFEGFAWDAAGRRYETLDGPPGLRRPGRRHGRRDDGGADGACARPRSLARACDLGVAMQLTNIARDVGEDARAGRLYLPLQWLREAGIEPDAWLARPRFSPALGRVVQRLLRAADRLYAGAMPGSRGCRRLPARRSAPHGSSMPGSAASWSRPVSTASPGGRWCPTRASSCCWRRRAGPVPPCLRIWTCRRSLRPGSWSRR